MTGPLDPVLRAFQEKEKLVEDAKKEEMDVELILSQLPNGFAKFANEDPNLEDDIAKNLAKKYDERIFKLVEKPWKNALR